MTGLTRQGRRGCGSLSPVSRRAARHLRRGTAVLISPVVGVGAYLVPVTAVAAGAAAITAVSTAVSATPAKASGSGTVLILSTSVNGGLSSAEAAAATALGYTVTVDPPATWDTLTTTAFSAFSAIVIGDPSSGGTCSSAAQADALSTASTWGAAITGNVAVLGTAPVFAGSSGASALISDGISYAGSGTGTGLYVSLNCEDSTKAAGTTVPLLASVEGGGYTVQGESSSCSTVPGTVNSWEAANLTGFNGLTDTRWTHLSDQPILRSKYRPIYFRRSAVGGYFDAVRVCRRQSYF